jgi:hypothetical protein
LVEEAGSRYSGSGYPVQSTPVQEAKGGLIGTMEPGTEKRSSALPTQDGQEVTITIHATDKAVKRLVGLMPWKSDPEELDRWLSDPDEGQWGNREVS